jgi:2-haloacid dehalogenase
MVILSNGSPRMLNAVVDNAGLRSHFVDVISVDQVRIFKPDQRVYRLATERFGISPAQVGFVSSNCWDMAGAAHFGFKTFWINRADQPVDELGQQPVAIVKGLDEVAARVRDMMV